MGKLRSAHICQTKLKHPFESVNPSSHWVIEYSPCVCSMVQCWELNARFIGKQCSDSFLWVWWWYIKKNCMDVKYRKKYKEPARLVVPFWSNYHPVGVQTNEKTIWIHVVSLVDIMELLLGNIKSIVQGILWFVCVCYIFHKEIERIGKIK